MMKKMMLTVLTVVALGALPGCGCKKDNKKSETCMKKEREGCCKKDMACKKDKCGNCHKSHRNKKCDETKKMAYHSYLQLEAADEALL